MQCVIIPNCVFMVKLTFIVSITTTARTYGKAGLAYPGLTLQTNLQENASAPLRAACFASAWMQPRTTEAPASSPITTLVIDGAKLTEAPRHDVAHLQRAETAAAVALVQAFLVHGLPHATLHSLHYYHGSNCGLAMRSRSVRARALSASACAAWLACAPTPWAALSHLASAAPLPSTRAGPSPLPLTAPPTRATSAATLASATAVLRGETCSRGDYHATVPAGGIAALGCLTSTRSLLACARSTRAHSSRTHPARCPCSTRPVHDRVQRSARAHSTCRVYHHRAPMHAR